MTRQSFGVQVHHRGSVTVRNDRRVNARIVTCPSCGAQIGEKCHSSAATELRGAHQSRRRMAIRALGEQVDVDAIKRLRSVRPFARAAVRKSAGHTQAELASLLGCPRDSVQRWERGYEPAGESGGRYAAWILERL